MMANSFYSYYSTAVAVAVAAFLLLHCAAANTVHVVGGNARWAVPLDVNFYAQWASTKTFRLNDVLSFQFTTDAHDVVEVPKASYDRCSDDNEIGNIIETGPYNHTLNKTGTHYFICSLGDHCNKGQKLTVNVLSASASLSPSGAPSPSSSNPQPPPPPGSAAPPALAAGSFIIMLSFALAKLLL